MSILAELARAYDRLPGAALFGYSAEKIGFLISLHADGTVAQVIDLRDGAGKKKAAKVLMVPRAEKRTVGIAPNFLWDKTAYVLSVTAGEGKRTAQEHAAFVARHIKALAGTDDAGLGALRAFLTAWSPEQFVAPLWPDDMKDQNVVFALESERLTNVFLHDRPAAQALWARLAGEGDRLEVQCLVSGENGPLALLHPSIKGVWGAQSSGASLVSFNAKSYESYGHEQGANAPVSEASAFAYGTALNTFLATGSGHRIQIGDASTVFWADARDKIQAKQAEAMFGGFFGARSDEDDKAASERIANDELAVLLEEIRKGVPLKEAAPDLAEGVRFHVLGLAPNAARLSVRLWLDNDFGEITRHYQRYIQEMRLEPLPPHLADAPLWRCLTETAVLGKRENIAPNLAGEWLRAILTGTPYPLTLLSTVLMRLRADREVTPLRVAILKALLIRNKGMEAPVALDPDNRNKGYLLGRLFAAYELVQSAALGPKVNATIKDKFYGAASAQPRSVFTLLDRGSANHLSKVGKVSPGRRVNLERQIGAIMEMMAPSEDPYPASLSTAEQAMFGLGYYHERSAFFRSRTDDINAEDNTQ